jgi:TolA-binding protein
LLAGAMAVRRLGSSRLTLDTPEAQQLRAQKRQVEESIEQLKYNKAGMDTDAYFEQLEKLLVELSQLQQRLDGMEKP